MKHTIPPIGRETLEILRMQAQLDNARWYSTPAEIDAFTRAEYQRLTEDPPTLRLRRAR